MKRWLHNPVLVSELKIKMRGFRAALAVTLYLGVMLLIAFLFFQSSMQSQIQYAGVNTNQSLGLQVYGVLALLQFFLIILVTPAQTAGTISGEREKQTLDLLLCTRMSSLSVIIGKLLSSMSFIFLLIIGSIPLFSLVFLFGGVGPMDIVMLFVFYLITAFAVGSIGIFCSALFKRTVVATVVAYVTVFALGILTIAIGGYMLAMHYRQPMAPQSPAYTPFVFLFNPAVGLGDLLVQQTGGGDGLGGVLGFLRPGGYLGGYPSGPGGIKQAVFQLSFWIKNALTLSVTAVLLLLLSSMMIKPVKKMWWFGKKTKTA